MKKKVPYLETSPERFPPSAGSGSFNTASPTPTGNRTAAILQPPKDSSSPTDNQLSTPWDDTSRVQTWADVVQADLDQARENLANGEHGEKDLELLQFWNTRIPVRQKS